MKYYIYKHTRLDTNEPFYIGFGTVQKRDKNGLDRTYYSRAYAKSARSTYWHNIVLKTEYTIDIIFETNNRDENVAKEIELIALYGRSDLGKGPLCNLTDGGELGGTNAKHNQNVSVIQLSLVGEIIKTWEQLKEIEEQLGFLRTNIVKCCRNKQKTAYGFKWEYVHKNFIPNRRNGRKIIWKHPYEVVYIYDKQSNLIDEQKNMSATCIKYNLERHNLYKFIDNKLEHPLYIFKKERKSYRNISFDNVKPVLQYDLDGNFIKEWDVIAKAARETNTLAPSISSCIKGKNKRGGNYIWKNVTENYPLKIEKWIKNYPKNVIRKRKITIKKEKPVKIKKEKVYSKVYKYTLSGQFVEEYKTVTIAAKYCNLKCVVSIYHAISGRAMSAAGFQWRFYKTLHIKSIENHNPSEKLKKKIQQFTLEDKFIKEWPSATDACKELNIKTSALRNCLCGLSKSAYKFKWKLI